MNGLTKYCRISISVLLALMFTLLLVGCGDSEKQNDKSLSDENVTETVSWETDVNSDIESASAEYEEVKDEFTGPITITHTDHDYVSVRISKELFNPEIADRGFQATFYDEQNNPCVYLFIQGEKDWLQCQICYGDIGDTGKSIVSDYGKYKDLGDSTLFEIILNDPNVMIGGGDNLTVPKEVFEKPVLCSYANNNDEWLSIDAAKVFAFETNEKRIKAKEQIDEILYTCDLDREYLTPESEDYRVEIYDIPAAVVYRTASTIRPPGGVLRFGTDPSRDGELINVQVIRVVEYDKTTKGLIAYSEKTIFPSERDTLCVVGTNFKNDNHPYLFIEQHGVDYLPDDFDPHEALKTICDTLMPDYYSQLCDYMGIKCRMVRDNNAYYRKFTDLKDVPYGEDTFSYFAEYDLLGCTLRAEGPEFGAHNCEETGMTSFTKQYEYTLPERAGNDEYSATIYYSKPDRHKQEITYGEENTGSFPEAVATMSGDALYFTPATDDYVIFYMRKDYDMICNERTVIVSFDANGNIVEAKFRLYKPDNMLNPMSDLIERHLLTAGESEMLYSEDNIAYFDITNCYDLRHNGYEGIKGDLLTKQELIEGSIDENLIKMPCESWSDAYGIYISSK